jgi:hypothetical protein
MLIFFLSNTLGKILAKRIFVRNYDFILVSYNDYQDTNYIHAILANFLKKIKTIKAVKETRLKRRYLELISLKNSNTIIYNTINSKKFFCKKYPEISDINSLIGLDEDWRPTALHNLVDRIKKNTTKHSSLTGETHFVILSGRVFSDANNQRSGARLYYIPLIKELIKIGIVHLHTFKIIPNSEGKNEYDEMREKNPKRFFIEESLNFDDNLFNSYSILAKYDLGILHANENTHEVSQFDAINIPNRLYEYLLLGIVPVVNDSHVNGINEFLCPSEYIKLSEIFSSKKSKIIELIKSKRLNWKKTFNNYIVEVVNAGIKKNDVL